MSQYTAKYIVKALAFSLGVVGAFFMAFSLCIGTISLITEPPNLINVLFFITTALPIYIIAVAYSVVKDYSNESIRNLCVLLCILLSFEMGYFLKSLVHNSNDPSMAETTFYLLATLGIPYLTYRILNYLNYKFINPKLALPTSAQAEGRP